MNAGFHVLEEILHGFEKGVEGSLIEKFSQRYGKDLELKHINQSYQDYLKDGSPEKRDSIKKRLMGLSAARKFESSGASELPLRDRRKFNSKMFYQHEEK